MKNNEWIELPIYQSDLYPKDIVEIAKKIGITVEEIAKNEGITPGVVLQEWVKREDIYDIFRIVEYPENEKMSVMFLLNGEQLIVNMPHKKLMDKIHRFLMKEPQYDYEQLDTDPLEIIKINGDKKND